MDNKLFSFGSDFKNNACINCSFDSLNSYIKGYKNGADILAINVIESSKDQDTLVYPIAFLYRQYVELKLKAFIKESKLQLNEATGFPKNHKIKLLWNDTKKLIKKIFATFDENFKEYLTKDDLKVIEKIISDFAEVDPESFTFRYPKDKQGNNNLEGLKHINIRNLAEQIELLSEKFDKFDYILGLLAECRANAN